MKILMVIDTLGKGGKERRLLELIKGLKQQQDEYEIYLVTLTDSIGYNYVYDLPITFEVLKRKSKKDISIVFKLRKIIRSFHPDIIHSWSTMSSIYLLAAKFPSNIPFINGVIADAHHNLGLSDKHYLRVKLTTPFSNVVVSNSEAGLRAYRIPKSKSVCIYNGIDFNRFSNLKPPIDVETEILGQPKGDRVIAAMMATFDERKDHATLVSAAIKMCTTENKIIFLFIGAGPTLEPLKKTVPPELLNKQIFFTGKRDDVESILQIIDIGVLLTNADTHGEGISNSIIEYMASGKPVIASRGGGSDEAILDEHTGFLIDPKNEWQTIEKIGLLLHNPELRTRMGKEAYYRAKEQFEVSEKTKEYIDLYKGLLPGKAIVPGV